MDIGKLAAEIRRHPQFDKAGMVLIHNGVVRGTSRDGRRVKGLRVAVDRERLARILAEQKKRPGIMLLAVAGDIRETVIAVLADTLNLIKKTVTSKTEYFS